MDASDLLFYRRTGEWDLSVTIKRDGSASLSPFGSSGLGIFPTAAVSLSPDQLQTLIQWIKSEQYTAKKSSFLSDLKNSERDKYLGTVDYYINENGKMRLVNEDGYLDDIILKIIEEAKKADKKNTD